MHALNNEILVSFTEVNKAIFRLVKVDADRLGITVVQLKTLYRLSVHPNISLSELAEQMRLTNSTVSGVIDRLVHSGLVERMIPPENRRTVSIHLTNNGKELLENYFRSDSLLIKKLNEVMKLPAEDLAHLLRLHKLILSKLTLEGESTT
jgi:MarR family transcriptional regulator, organic hydroperoxide resistance regulator